MRDLTPLLALLVAAASLLPSSASVDYYVGIFTLRHRDVYVHGGLFGALLLITTLDLSSYWRRQMAHDRLEANYETERKRAEEALHQSEARYRELFGGIKSGVAVYTAWQNGEDFVFTDLNPAGERLDNITKQEVVGRRVTEVFPGVVAFGLLDVFRRVSKTGQPEHHPVSFYHDNRITGWRENYVYRLAAGEVVAVYDDVTERKQAEEALREAAQRLKFHVENSPLAVVEFDREFRVIFWSNVAQRVFGWSAEEILGKRIDQLRWVHEEDAARVAALSADMFAGRHTRNLHTNRNYRKDGSVIICDWYNSALIDSAGDLVSVLSLVVDITERKQAEAALLESERKLRLIAENATDVIFAYDMDRRLIYVNPALEEFTGYSVAELREKNFINWSHPEDEAKMKALWEDLFAGKGFAGEEFRIVTKDGQIKWCSGSWGLLYDESGRQIGVQGRERDITERKRTEGKLIAIMKAVESTSDAIGISDAQGHHWFQNRALSDLFGYATAEELEAAGGGPAVVKDPEVAKEMFENILSGKSWVGELEMVTKSGRIFPAYERADAIIDNRGKIIGLIGIVTDITERKRAEDALHNSSKRLRELSRRLIEAEDSVRRTINRELHDRVGAHLSALNLNLSILGSQLPSESLRAVGSRLRDAQKLLEETTTHVRDLMADLHPPALDDYGLLAALRTYVESFSARFDVPISVHGEPFVPRLPLAAETALFRVAQGALVNAVTHAHAKRIEILLAASPDRVALTIADDGAGFDVAQAAQAHASWGLVIMRERAEAVGATLTVEAAPGKGTRVCVEIPREKR